MSHWSSLVLVAALATSAHADVWQRAIERGDVAAARDKYEQALHDGDELALLANAKSQPLSKVVDLVDRAVHSYEAAAAARPKEGEPYFRIASTIESFFTDCSFLMQQRPATCPTRPNSQVDIARAKQAVDAWDAFEVRAPLDPRVGEALFSRAILRTKLVTKAADAKPHLEGALADYTALLDRADGLTMLRLEQVWGNLAETYMMLGKLDESIEAYQVAIDKGANSSTYYGKAVALDRDERGTEALAVIRAQGFQAFEDFRREIIEGVVFYVPDGEQFYYFALIYEAFGYYNEAIQNWKLFIDKGAHPQYQPRAKAHIDALQVKQISSPRLRTPPDPFDLYP